MLLWVQLEGQHVVARRVQHDCARAGQRCPPFRGRHWNATAQNVHALSRTAFHLVAVVVPADVGDVLVQVAHVAAPVTGAQHSRGRGGCTGSACGESSHCVYMCVCAYRSDGTSLSASASTFCERACKAASSSFRLRNDCSSAVLSAVKEGHGRVRQIPSQRSPAPATPPPSSAPSGYPQSCSRLVICLAVANFSLSSLVMACAVALLAAASWTASSALAALSVHSDGTGEMDAGTHRSEPPHER